MSPRFSWQHQLMQEVALTCSAQNQDIVLACQLERTVTIKNIRLYVNRIGEIIASILRSVMYGNA